MAGWCDRCANTGEIDCYCGGDLCVCGQQTMPCPDCDGAPDYDDPALEEPDGPEPLDLM